jgi:hypothetical protein
MCKLVTKSAMIFAATLGSGQAVFADQNQTIFSPGDYSMQLIHSNKCITPPTSDGLPYTQNDCDGSAPQSFRITIQSDDTFKIHGNLDTNKVMQPENKSSAEGARIVQVANDGSTYRKWVPKPNGDGWIFVNESSNLCLSVADGAQNNGDTLLQTKCSGAPNHEVDPVVEAIF